MATATFTMKPLAHRAECEVPVTLVPLSENCLGRSMATVEITYKVEGCEPTIYPACPLCAGRWASEAADPEHEEWLGGPSEEVS